MRQLAGALAVLVGGFLLRSAADGQAPPAAPSLQIDSFAATRAYAVGAGPLSLVATVRNVGKDALPAGSAAARVYCLAGLDYREGDTRPPVPALEPGGSATLRWRLQVTEVDGPIVAALALQSPGSLGDVRVLAVQHFARPPTGEASRIEKAPTARAARDGATIENDRVRARIVSSASRVPVLLLSARIGNAWRQAGVSLPLAEVLSAEGGQRPWWEVFRSDSAVATNGKGEAALALTGGFGLRWRATLTFTLRAGSSVLDARLSLSPLKSVRLSGYRLLPLYAGDGAPPGSRVEVLPVAPSGPDMAGTVRWDDTTTRAVWPGTAPWPEWHVQPMAQVEGADYRFLGVETLADAAPRGLMSGALVETRARLVTLAPGPAARDGLGAGSPGPGGTGP